MRYNRELESLAVVQEYLATKGFSTEVELDEFSHNDLFVTSEKYNGAKIEVKQRHFTLNQVMKYSVEGFIMEEMKYNYLRGFRSLYINYFMCGDKKILLG
jgi:hypothetical protein